MNQRVKVAIGLGSNQGDRQAVLEEAIRRLGEEFLENLRASSLYETPPWEKTDQPPFLNAVVVGISEWKPPAIVNYLKRLETEMGRRPGPRYGPRVLDLDLLVYGEQCWESDGVKVPHDRIEQREFVLVPLCELWPDWRHPVIGRTARQLQEALRREQPPSATRVAPPPAGTKSP